MALLGPNGAGKTHGAALPRRLARRSTTGHITLDGQCLDDPDIDRFVAAEQRPVGVVFQNYLLFPQPRRDRERRVRAACTRRPQGEGAVAAAAWLERVGLTDHAHQRPGALSGGQAQRVALARALATEPRLLLLDEPLAALDAGARTEVRRDLRRHLATFDGVRLLVTHDPVDAYALADRVVILEGGTVAQSGTLADVTARPRSRYIADLIGVNLVSGVGGDGMLTTAAGGRVVPADTVDGPAFAVIQPHSVALYPSPPAGSPRNVWPVTVVEIDRHADRVRVRVDGEVPLVAEITPSALEALALRPGDEIWASVKATEITTYAV